MSLEVWSTIASIGTFIVIAATAVAAIVQLRHARSGNQIAALQELRDAFQSREFSDALAFVETRIAELVEDPEFRYQFLNRAARTEQYLDAINYARLIGNYFEDMGALVAAGLLDRELTCTIYSSDVTRAWDALEQLVAMGRRTGGKAIWENFEYIAMLVKRWLAAHPDGGYPAGAPRLEIVDRYAEADRLYAAARITALEAAAVRTRIRPQ